MVSALLGSQTVNLAQWGVFVRSRTSQEASHQRRWQRFLQNERVVAENIYVPLVLQGISGWKQKRIYLALDTTVLWNKYCLVSLAVITEGRPVPFLWLTLEHSNASASVAWKKYQPLLEKARQYLGGFSGVFQWESSGIRSTESLGHLYIVIAIALSPFSNLSPLFFAKSCSILTLCLVLLPGKQRSVTIGLLLSL